MTNEKTPLPCPRLEFQWKKFGNDWYDRECIYSLVLPLREHDIRIDTKNGKKALNENYIEMGRTKVTGGNGSPPITGNIVDTPFREFSHAIWDCSALGGQIPIVAICEDMFTYCKNEAELKREAHNSA